MENRSKGIILILLSALFFALMAACVKSVPNIPLAEKIFFRNLFGLIVASNIIFRNKKPILGNNKKFLLLRSIFGLLGVAAYFYSLTKIPLADAVILNKLSPFFVLILSAIFLGERIKKLQVVALVFSVIGAVLVIKPEFEVSILPYLLALSSSFSAGSAYTIIRHLRHTDASETIVFYFTFISTVAMIPFMIFGSFVVPSMQESLGLLGVGIFATAAQFLMTNAYRFAPAGELAIYTYTNIVFSTLFGIIIWSEIPGFTSLIGGLVIIGAGFINYYSNRPPKSEDKVQTK